jgi:hypothetical protein
LFLKLLKEKKIVPFSQNSKRRQLKHFLFNFFQHKIWRASPLGWFGRKTDVLASATTGWT